MPPLCLHYQQTVPRLSRDTTKPVAWVAVAREREIQVARAQICKHNLFSNLGRRPLFAGPDRRRVFVFGVVSASRRRAAENCDPAKVTIS